MKYDVTFKDIAKDGGDVGQVVTIDCDGFDIQPHVVTFWRRLWDGRQQVFHVIPMARLVAIVQR